MLHLRILTGFWIHPWDLESYQAKRLSDYTHWMLLLGGPIRNKTDFLKTRWSLTDINLEFFPFKLKIWPNIIECALSKIRINKTNKFSHCLFFWEKAFDLREYPANIYLFKVNNRNSGKRWKYVTNVVLVFLLLILNVFYTIFRCFYCWLWTKKILAG